MTETNVMKSRFFIVLTFLVLSPFFGKTQTNQNFNKTYQTTSKDFETENGYYHIEEDGDTIVSFKNKEQEKKFYERMEKQGVENIKDLVYDPSDPSFGLVPYRPGNDTIPQQDVWELKDSIQKTSRIEQDIFENKVDTINPLTSGFTCGHFATQMGHIDFFGIYNIENSGLTSGVTLPYNYETNGAWENPSYLVRTTTTEGYPHAINAVFIGADNVWESDVTDFDQWYFWEPQTDERVFSGDYSMDENGHAWIEWWGYTYAPIPQNWVYTPRQILKFNLDNGNAILEDQDEELTTFWDPLSQAVYPLDQEHEFYVGITQNLDPGYPDSLYVGTQVNHSMDSTQTNNQTCSDVTFNQEHIWELIAGAYKSSNSPQGSHVQDIFVHDWTAPEFEVNANGPYNVWDNSGLPVTFEKDSTSTQGTDSTQCGNYYGYDITESYTGIDVCENSDTKDYITQIQDLTGPIVIEYPVANGDTIFAPEGAYIHPDSLDAWAVWEDPEGSPIIKEYDEQLIEETEIYRLWRWDQFGSDVCSNPSQDDVWHCVHEPKPTGINNKKSLEFILGNPFPNPTKGKFKIPYFSTNTENIHFKFYNSQGQELENIVVEPKQIGENELNLNLSEYPPGLYFLNVNKGKSVETKKIFVK